jgi:nitrite reductase (NADH) small subunit
VDVGAVEDFADRTMTLVQAGGIEIGVCRWGSEFFALRSRCPHQAAPLCRGFLQTRLSGGFTAEGVRLESDTEEPMILCPWHRWEFSLRSGESAWPGYRARTYPVTVDGGRVLVRMKRS